MLRPLNPVQGLPLNHYLFARQRLGACPSRRPRAGLLSRPSLPAGDVVQALTRGPKDFMYRRPPNTTVSVMDDREI